MLVSALKNNHIWLADYLLNNGADIKVLYENKIINFLAKNGMLETLQLLHSFDVNINFRFGKSTPLYQAIKHGHLHVVKFILDKMSNRNELIRQSA